MYKSTKFSLLYLSVFLISCGGETPTSDEEEKPTATNAAPSHNGALSLNINESDAIASFDLLSGATDTDGDVMSVINFDLSEGDTGLSITGSTLTVDPSFYVDSLISGEEKVWSFDYEITDGTASVSRTLTITIAGEGEAQPLPEGYDNTLVVDFNVQQYIGQVSHLDRSKFFNMHDNHFSSHTALETIQLYKDHYRVGHGRQFWSPLAIAKDHLSQNGTYPSTAHAVQNGSKDISNHYSNPRANLADNRIVITDHPRNVITENNDPIDGARWAADHFEHFYDDQSRPLFYEPMNEPFVHAGDFTALHGNQDNVREHMTTWFSEIGKAFDARPALKDVNVIGFASAWPSLELNDFSHWESRMKMFMDNAGDNIDSFSTHLYDGINIVGAASERTGSNSQAILDLVEAYSNYKWDVVKPHAITEYGAIVDRPDGVLEYDPVVNSQTIRSFNGIMLELMNREDRVLTSIPFITGTSVFYWQSPTEGNGHPYNPAMWRPNRDNIELVSGKWQFKDQTAADNYLLNDSAMFLEFWRDVEGYRVHTQNIDPDLQTLALVNADQAFVVLNNLEHSDKVVDLNIADIINTQFTSVTVERIAVHRDKETEYTTVNHTLNTAVTNDNFTLGQLTLAAGEAVKFTFGFSSVLTADSTAQIRSYYADEHLQTIVQDQAITFNFNGVEIGQADDTISFASLRMGIARKHSKSKQPIVKVNGTIIPVPNDWAGYDQTPRDDFFGSLDIPVPFELLTANTVVTVTFPDSQGRVSSMNLEVNNAIDAFVVTDIAIFGDDNAYVGANIPLSASITPEFLNLTGVTWTTSEPNVATINENGVVTTLSVGTTVITALSNNGITDELTFTVKQVSDNLLSDANSDFEFALSDSQIVARNSTGQVNVASFAITADAAKDGLGGLEVDNSAGSLKLQFVPTAVIQGIDTTKNYVVSADVKVVSGTHAIWTEIENGTGGWKNASVADSAEWQHIEIEYTGSDFSNSFGLNFHVDPTGEGTGGIIYVDNIKVLPSNE